MSTSTDSQLAPIVLFVYNRPLHTKQTLDSLKANVLADQSELFIYADGPKPEATQADMEKITEVRQLLRQEQWCKTVHIIESDNNKGLADSIITGVTETVNRFGKVIVLEDDLILSKSFLLYMTQALNLYANDERVVHVSGYMYPVKGTLPKTFFVNLATCWGWGTWKRAWNHFERDSAVLLDKLNATNSRSKFNLEDSYDWYSHLVANVEGRMKTWAIRWYSSFYLRDGFCLHPNLSLVRNIGNDLSGVHCGTDHILLQQKIGEIGRISEIPVVESLKARKLIKEYFVESQQIVKGTSVISSMRRIVKIFFHK